jgi:hypothetical protein
VWGARGIGQRIRFRVPNEVLKKMASKKSVKPVAMTVECDDSRLLDFVIKASTYPSKFLLSAASTNNPAEKFYCKYGPDGASDMNGGLVYGSSPRQAIAGAVIVAEAQARAQRILEDGRRAASFTGTC